MKKMKIPKGKVGIVVTVKIVDPAEPKKDYSNVENRLTKEAISYLNIFLDPRVNRELFK
jgi:hypothetical protein